MNTNHIVTGDLLEIAALPASVTGWNANFTQMGKGELHTEVKLLHSGHMNMTYATLDKDATHDGEAPSGCRTFVIRMDSSGFYRAYGKDIRRSEILALPISRELDMISKASIENVTISLSDDILGSLVKHWEVDSMLHQLESGGTFRPSEESLATLRQTMLQVSSCLNTNCSPRMLANIREDIIASFGSCITTACGFAQSIVKNSRTKTVQKAVEFIRETPTEPLSLAEICKAAEVSERTLHYAFKQCLGLTPKAYAKKYRLNQVHKALRKADATSVTETALQYGFWHMGQFGVDYKKLFGELPSETLHREFKNVHFHIPLSKEYAKAI